MIDHIRLKNFKCFIDEPFELAPLTMFTGINGMGKSSVIQSLLILKQSFESTVLQTKNIVDLYNFSFTDLESAEDLCNANAYPKVVEITLKSGDNIFSWVVDASVPDATKLPVQYFGSDNWMNLSIFQKDFQYVNAERLGPRKSYKRNEERIFNTKLGIQGELTPVYIFDAINKNETIGIEALKHRKNSSIGFYENLNAWMGDILGREITAKVAPQGKEDVRLTFNIKGSKGGDFSALQVGFGYSFCLPIIAAALTCKPGDLLIVENPEAHLHPSAQSRIGILLALVAKHGVQVFIETHSDHVLNGIRVLIKGIDEYGQVDADILKVHYFTNEKSDDGDYESKRTLSALPNGKLSGWPQGFFDEWENNLQRLVF